MEFLKRVLCLLLVFSFTFQGVVAQTAAPTAGGEETETPQNPPGTPPGVTCSNFGEKPLPPHGVCCVGLVPDVGGFCDEPALVDNSLVSCTDASSCGQGMGCLPQTVETLFSRLAPSTTPVDEINEQKQHLEAQVEDIALKDTDQSCRHHKECHSYSCVAGKCEDKKVCRMAGEGEAAPSGVNCGPDLIRNQSGICEPSPEARNTVYLGLLKEATLRPLSQCQFEVSNEMREKSIVAMKSLRAMEYFFSTVSLDFQEECFQVMPLLKHEVGTVMFESRKNILRNFTEILNQIEKDYATILAASQSYTQSLGSNGNVDQNSNTVAVHRDVDQTATNFVVHNEPISQADLGSRLTSGYDAMMIMYRRNLLFQAYEQAMFEVLKLIGPKITGLSTNMKDWNDGDTSWNIGTRTVNSYSCEGSKYKKKKKWKWTTKYYNSIKDRWTNYYEVTGNAEANANIVKRENVARVLGLLSGFEEKSEEAAQADAIRAATEKAIEDFTSPKFYLIDPLLFAGMKHGQYGQAKSLAKKGGFLGFSGFKDLRHAYSIKGDAAGSFTRIHGDVTTRVRDFYKTLKSERTQTKFVYEPELVTTSAKDCLENEKTKECASFETFLDGVADESFAHFLAYSHYDRDSYSNFFRNATTYRRKLLAKLEVDIQNISLYYNTIINHRNEQNSCIEKLINGVIDSGILTDSTSGVQEGDTVRPRPVTGLNVSTNQNAARLKVTKVGPATRSKFLFNLRETSLKSLTDASLKDSVSGVGSTSERGDVGSSASAYLAVRSDAMNKANQKAKAQGVNVSGKDKVAGKFMSQLGRSALGQNSSIGTMNTSSKTSFAFGPQGSAAVSKTDALTNSAGTGEGVSGGKVIGLGDKAGGSAAQGEGATGASNTLSESQGGVESSLGTGKMDGTGLSDEEKEKLLSEAERNKKDYKESEEDGLFGKVSKAYVRNLDKVLKKKKEPTNP